MTDPATSAGKQKRKRLLRAKALAMTDLEKEIATG